jgi:hypothetical protein
MRHFRLLFGLAIFLAVANSPAADEAAKAPPPVPDDLKKLQGTWSPVKKIEKIGYLHLQFGKDLKDKKDYLAVIHAVDGGGMMLNVGDAVVKIALKEVGKKRVITATKKSESVSNIVYKFEGDRLVIEEGECNIHRKVSLKGRWERLPGDNLP